MFLPALLRKGDFGDIDRWFERALSEGDEINTYWPKIDIHEDKDNLYVEADLPGLDQKDIKVEIDENNILSISGERNEKKEEEKRGFYRIERQYGKFERRFHLGQNVDGSQAKAEYKHGVLKLTVPKKAEKKPKAIDIEVK